nr:MAG TPA: DNA polymerase II small subunit [Caudoviricetes sp.]
MLDFDYKRHKDEGVLEYEYRICGYKDQIGTWQDVADLLNEQLGQEYTESKYRKQYQEMNKIITFKPQFNCNESELLEEIKEQRRLLEKAKIQMRDERNEVSRLYRENARRESFSDMIKRCIEGYEPAGFTCFRLDSSNSSTTDMIVPISDLHFGVNINNMYNTYNRDVASDRLSRYLGKVLEIARRHNTENVSVVLLGDQISGLIHTSLRLENNENVIKQTMDAAELISNYIYTLSSHFKKVSIYSVSGNHSRLQPEKALNQKGEDLDKFIPFYIKAKLQNCDNVTVYDNTIDESVASFICKNMLVYAVHGDRDGIGNVVQKLTMMTGDKPDIVYMGHLHTNQYMTIYDTKVIQSGCISGSDSYCMDNRLRSKPEQAVSVIGDNGLECVYDVTLG